MNVDASSVKSRGSKGAVQPPLLNGLNEQRTDERKNRQACLAKRNLFPTLTVLVRTYINDFTLFTTACSCMAAVGSISTGKRSSNLAPRPIVGNKRNFGRFLPRPPPAIQLRVLQMRFRSCAATMHSSSASRDPTLSQKIKTRRRKCLVGRFSE